MGRSINWKHAGIVVLVWTLITAFGLYQTLTGSQFRNADFKTISGANITDYLLSSSTCSSGSDTSSCFNVYAVASYGSSDENHCFIINEIGAENGTQALMKTEAAYPLYSILTIYRHKGSSNCQTHKRTDTGAIIGVVLLCISGLVLFSLPLTGTLLFDTVIAEDGASGRVQAIELLSLTPKEAAEAKREQSIAMARKASMRMNRDSNRELSARFSKILVEMQRQQNAEEAAGAGSGSGAGSGGWTVPGVTMSAVDGNNGSAEDWASINPSKIPPV